MRRYLYDDTPLMRGSIDDTGDARYLRLTQNVPDGYVVDLQQDLHTLGFDQVGEADGAFGKKTKSTVQAFQRLAKLPPSGIVDSPTRDELLLWLENSYTASVPPASADPPAVAPADELTLIAPRVPHFSQGDPRWAKRVLGAQSSIARQGCALCCVAMILRFFGRPVHPAILDAYLDQHDGYVGDSIRWDVAGRCAQEENQSLKYNRTKDDLEATLAARIAANLPTIVRVDYGTDANLTYNHFVVGVGKKANGHIIMNDPATMHGNGYQKPLENTLQTTTRKEGYTLVQLDWYDLILS